jgi:uncharacterized protein YndB with AHSA1/START domain
MARDGRQPAERDHRPQSEGAAGKGLGGDHVRPGGRFSVVFRLLNGEEHNPTGIYQEVIPEKKLVFTWEAPGMPEWESLVTFLLEPIDGGTRLTLRHENLPEAARNSHEQGWSGLLDKLPIFLGVTEWAN